MSVSASKESSVSLQGFVSRESTSQHTASLQGTGHPDLEQDVNPPQSPNDYTSTDGSQTSGGDGGEMDTYALTREFRRLKKVVTTQADQLKRLQDKFRRLKRFVWPLVKHHKLWVKHQRKSDQKSKKASTSKRKKLRKQSSFTLGRNLDVNMNEDAEPHYEDTSLFEDIAHQGIAEGKSDENVVLEEENMIAGVLGDDIQSTGIAQSTGVQSTVDQGTAALNVDEIGPSTRTLDEKVGPSNPI